MRWHSGTTWTLTYLAWCRAPARYTAGRLLLSLVVGSCSAVAFAVAWLTLRSSLLQCVHSRKPRSSRAADLWLVCKLLPHYSSPEAQRGDACVAAVEAFVLRLFAADCLTPTSSVAQMWADEAARNPFCLAE